jgi:hypothetical protein
MGNICRQSFTPCCTELTPVLQVRLRSPDIVWSRKLRVCWAIEMPFTPTLEAALKAIPNNFDYVFINKRTGELYTGVRKPLKDAMKKPIKLATHKSSQISSFFCHNPSREWGRSPAYPRIIRLRRTYNYADLHPCYRRPEETGSHYCLRKINMWSIVVNLVNFSGRLFPVNCW